MLYLLAAMVWVAGSAKSPSLPVTEERILSLEHLQGEPDHVAAASALVGLGGAFYVAADDELFMGAFPRDPESRLRGHRIPVLSGALPSERQARKAKKPDFECLVRLPAFAGYPHGALLILGSGSKTSRSTGALKPIGADGELSPVPWVSVDAAPLYDVLRKSVPKLNIEGAVVARDELVLLQRGNGVGNTNDEIRLDLGGALEELRSGSRLTARSLKGVRTVALGERRGVPLGFTDGVALPDGRILFSAVAEDSRSTVEDGQCTGSILGILERDGTVSFQVPIEGNWKVEGLSLEARPEAWTVWMVADGDDRAEPAPLLKAVMKPPSKASL